MYKFLIRSRFFQTFFTPSDSVQKIIDSIKLPTESVAMVIRTGWDDWQRFLVKETEDPLKFPACLEGWRSKGKTPTIKYLGPDERTETFFATNSGTMSGASYTENQ